MRNSHTLEYSCCNEDSRSELRALRPQGRRVLSLAAGGGRAFSLLLGDPRQVVAIDQNQDQIHLCLLKYHAIRHLSRNAYLDFVGIGPGNDRFGVYSRWRSSLPDDTRTFWDSHPAIINKGIIYAGNFDQHIIRLARVLRFFAFWPIHRIRSCTTVEEQIRYIAPAWRKRLWMMACQGLFHPWMSKTMHPHAAPSRYDRNLGLFFYSKLKKYLRHNLFSDSHFLCLFTQGRLTPDGPLPLHLQQGNYEIVRERLDRLVFVCCDIDGYLENHGPNFFDAFSLSDVGSYLSQEEMAALLNRIERASTPGALICLREYVAPLGHHTVGHNSLRRDRRLEKELARADKCLGYTFICARVDK